MAAASLALFRPSSQFDFMPPHAMSIAMSRRLTLATSATEALYLVTRQICF
jgi:hypothetical protein